MEKSPHDSRYVARSKKPKHQPWLTQDLMDEIMKQDVPAELLRFVKPCWRCQFTKQQCDGRTPCRACKKHKDQCWSEVGCQYANLDEEVLQGIPDFPGLGYEEWLLPVSDHINLKVQMQYADPDIKIHDLNILPNWSDTPEIRLEDIITFLEQFYHLEERWRGTYELFTTDLIRHCADIQIEVMAGLTPGQEMFSDGCLLIAYSLRLLAFSHAVFELEISLPCMRHGEYFEREYLVPQIFWAGDGDPSMEVYIFLPGVHTLPEEDQSKQPKGMLQVIYRTIHKILLRGRKSDMPAVFSAFCLLHLIRNNLEAGGLPDCPLDIGPFDKHLQKYTELYLATTGDLNPLSEDWDDRQWRELIGEGHWAAPLFETFSDIWGDRDGFEDDYSELNFREKIDRLCMGYI